MRDLSALTHDWLKRWESLGAKEQRFKAQVDSIAEIRATAALAQQTAVSLKAHIERLLIAPAASARDRQRPIACGRIRRVGRAAVHRRRRSCGRHE